MYKIKISKLKSPIYIYRIESKMNKLPNQKASDSGRFIGEFYQIFKGEIMPIFCDPFQKKKAE